MAIELRNTTSEGKRNGGLCGGDLDPRVVAAQAVVEELLDAPETDKDLIQAAMMKLELAYELRNITSEGKRNGGLCGGDLDPRVVAAQAVLEELLDAPETDKDLIQAAMMKLELAIELRNITSRGKSEGGSVAGSCGGDKDYRVERALAKVEEILDASETDEDAIQAAMKELEEAYELQQKTHDGKSKNGFEHSIRNADKLNKPYLLLESVSRCEAAKIARPKFVPMCSRIQADLLYELEAEGSLKITNPKDLSGPQAKMKGWIKSANDNERDKSHTFSVRGNISNRALYPDDEWKITIHPTKATIRWNVRFVEGDRETAK